MENIEGSKARRGRLGTANRIVNDILKCDEAIETVLIVDSKGELLASATSERLREESMQPEENLQKYASLTAIMLGAANVHDERIGGLEFMTPHSKG